MTHAFKTISAKPTFGNLRENLYQSDYIHRKKSLSLLNTKPSRHELNSFNIHNCTFLPSNKNNLIAGQYTKLNLTDVCTVSEINYKVNPQPCSFDLSYICNPCQNNSLIKINPKIETKPFYYQYQIDPLGELFGKTQCGELNYTHYMIYKPYTIPHKLENC